MTIEKTIRGKKVFYSIKNGGMDYIADFDTLEEAALVLRYLSGSAMPEKDSDRALELMKTR